VSLNTQITQSRSDSIYPYAGQDALAVPALVFIELADEFEQPVGAGIEVGGQLGDFIGQAVDELVIFGVGELPALVQGLSYSNDGFPC